MVLVSLRLLIQTHCYRKRSLPPLWFQVTLLLLHKVCVFYYRSLINTVFGCAGGKKEVVFCPQSLPSLEP